jgi:predicted nucleotidyltransferase component of viral defense system
MLRARIADYKPVNSLEQENVIQELMQCFVLASLSRARFFGDAGFHGGTCLRLLFGLNRFSEDLDFLLKDPNPQFVWSRYLEQIQKDFREEGIHLEARDKSDLEKPVKKAFLKTDSFGQILTLELPFTRHRTRKVRIKLEIDSNPPAGSDYETRYIDFPVTAAITTQTLASGFATKSHALLCRGYTKGRDWYDFLWYLSRRVAPNYELLGNALHQQGPWAGGRPRITSGWYVGALRRRIEEIDWIEAREDVSRFVVSREQESIGLWTKEFFLYQVDRLEEYLGKSPRGGN